MNMGSTGLALSGDCRGLTDKQRKFVAEYVIDYNGSRAARAAGYKNAAIMASRLLKDPKISRAIGNIQRKNLENAILSKDEIIKELSVIAMRDPIEMCDENGMIRTDDLRQIPAHIRRSIDGIKVKQSVDPETGEVYQEFELKLVGKATAIRMLMEHFGLFAAQQHEVTGAITAVPWEQLFAETKEDVNVIEGKIQEVRKKK